MPRPLLFPVATLAALLTSASLTAKEPPADAAAEKGKRLFDEKIEPVLAKLCFECHSRDIEEIVDGLEQAPVAFIGLLEGKNFGKLAVRVGEDSVQSPG